jgi:hypothetical protein
MVKNEFDYAKEQRMRTIILGTVILNCVCTAVCHSETDAVRNRRNRYQSEALSKQYKERKKIQRNIQDISSQGQSVKPQSEREKLPLSMPALFDPSITKHDKQVSKQKIEKVQPKEEIDTGVHELASESLVPEQNELKDESDQGLPKLRKPGVYRNDHESVGIHPIDFYQQLSPESKQIFAQLGPEGQKLALRLSVPYSDKNKAVQDAFYEMERRKQAESVRLKRSHRSSSVFL